MTIRLRGICAIADQHVHSGDEGQVYTRKSFHVRAEVPLYYAGQRVKEDGTTADEATSFTAILEKLGGYLLLTCDLYDDDEESELLEEAVESGVHALALKAQIIDAEFAPYRAGRVVRAMDVFGVSLDINSRCIGCYCWIERDHKVQYQIHREVFEAIQNYYEATMLPTPEVVYIPNGFRAADDIGAPLQPAQAPFTADYITMMPKMRSNGMVDLLISDRGTLLGEVRAGPALIATLREALEQYDILFPHPTCDGDFR